MNEQYMQRCFDLAVQGISYTSPNPIVGAVIVHNDRIIGEGFHQRYGQAHAEVNAVNSVAPEDRTLLPYSTLYVSLEPCNIFGNTPPCTHLILKEKIPEVVISYIDHTPGVDGSGIDFLKKQGVKVTTGILEKEGRNISAVRNTFVTKNRPYILLKYAQSANNIFAPEEDEQLWLSNPYSKRLVHRWRSETSAILIGTQTAITDNPRLNNRLYYGPSPVRVVIDRKGRLINDLNIKDGSQKTLIFTYEEKTGKGKENLEYITCPKHLPMIEHLLRELVKRKISSLMIEGGIQLLDAFIAAGFWDEARIFISDKYLNKGRQAPQLTGNLVSDQQLLNDRLLVFNNPSSKSLNLV